LLAAASLAIAACQPVPQPFRPDAKPAETGSLHDRGPRAGLIVPPVAGLPGNRGQRLADAMADALRAEDVAASSRAVHRQAWLLQGLGEGGGVLWRLVDPRGLNRGERRLAAEVDRAAIGALLDLIAATESSLGARLPALSVAPGSGAPGDGDTALAEAMRRALTALGVEVHAGPRPGAPVLRAAVAMTPAGADDQRVEIDWVLRDAAGAELGAAKQSNLVPRGSLDGRWGAVAALAAEAGAEGVIEILQSLGGR